jgi:hypothetical protein
VLDDRKALNGRSVFDGETLQAKTDTEDGEELFIAEMP